ncbi:MAG: HPP family protein [Clostridia bacterium]|nr:HPP family protein [Clostridia bacterium]
MFSIDKKFKNNKRRYIFQCALVTISLSIVFSMLDLFFETGLVAALGATTFIVFTTPSKEISRAHYIIGGYVIGAIVGLVLIYIAGFFPVWDQFFGAWAALGVGLAMFLMVVLDFEHPPAAGVTLGLITDGGHLHSVLIAFLGIFAILLLRRLLAKWLIDLL